MTDNGDGMNGRTASSLGRVALTAMVAVAASGCGLFSSSDSLRPMSLMRAGRAGTVTVERSGEEIRVTDQLDIGTGDVIVTSGGARARLQLEAERYAWIGTGSRVEVIDGTSLEITIGTVVAEAQDAMSLNFNEATARSDEARFRVDVRSASGRAASYSGNVDLTAPGERRLNLDGLFEASVVSGHFVRTRPYQMDERDPWDSLYLEDLLALQQHLDDLAAGFSSQLGRARPSLGYFSMLAEKADVGFMKRYLDDRSPSELMIAFSIARSDSGRSLGSSFRRAFGLRDLGGEWAIVSEIMNVTAGSFVAQLEDVILTGIAAAGEGDGSGFGLAAGAPTGTGRAPDTGGQEPSPSSDAGPAPTGDGDGGDGGDGSGDPGNGDPGDGDPGDGGGSDCDNPVECTVEQLPLPGPSPTIELPGLP